MFDGLITGMLAVAIADTAAAEEITELRLRVSRPLVVGTLSGARIGRTSAGAPYIVSRADVDRVLGAASDFSVYAVNDELIRGYMARGGVRIGVAGEGVVEGGKLITMKHISCLTVRIPHQVRGAAAGAESAVFGGGISSALVISPPGGGKTTLLRELGRLASSKCNTMIIDERFELAAAKDGVPVMDVGDADVVSGVSKAAAYESCVRAMCPDLIVTDELFRADEVSAVCDIVRSGVKVFASVHGDSAERVLANSVFAPLKEVFDVFIELSRYPRAGTLSAIKPRHRVGRQMDGRAE